MKSIENAHVLNLIKCHVDKNDEEFKKEAYKIANEFDNKGECQLAAYIWAMFCESGINTFVPQDK